MARVWACVLHMYVHAYPRAQIGHDDAVILKEPAHRRWRWYVAGISSASSETSTLLHRLIIAKTQEEAIEEHLADIKNTVASMTHDGGAEIQKGRVSAAGASPSQVPSEPIYMNILWWWSSRWRIVGAAYQSVDSSCFSMGFHRLPDDWRSQCSWCIFTEESCRWRRSACKQENLLHRSVHTRGCVSYWDMHTHTTWRQARIPS